MQPPILSPAELSRLLGQENLKIFDCRHDLFHPEAGRQAHEKAHLPGARYLHLDEDLSGEIIPEKTGRHPLPALSNFLQLLAHEGVRPESHVVCYDDKGGGIAARLWWMLRSIGHDKVQVLDGGFPAWQVAGLTLDAGSVADPVPTALYPAPSSFLGTCGRAQIAALPPKTVLVDSRTAPRYRGEHEPIDPVAGHIPGAINYPWPDNLTDGKFKTREELKIRFAELHDEADNVIFYCGSGVTACHNLLAYEYAFGKLEGLYPGSWSKWILG